MKKQRARKDEDKLQRRQAILDAGEKLFASTSFSKLTMNDVADEAGVAKGTVYLYFPTKEGLFLDLLQERMLGWVEDFDRRLLKARAEWSADRLVKALADSLEGREALVRMLTMQGTILEHNVSVERVRAFKIQLLQLVSRTATHLAERVPFLTFPLAMRVLIHVHAVVVGLGQMAFPAEVTREVCEDEALRLFKIDFRKEFTFATRAMLRGLAQED